MPLAHFRRLLLWSLALSLGATLVGVAARGCLAQQAAQTEQVAMHDGVKLATDVYLPKREGKFPTVLVRTPYNKDGMKGGAGNLLKTGCAVVAQDMRGRFASEGQPAIIFGNEGLGGKHRDGQETMEWIARQPWSNGKIVTWGASALGIAQNMAAPDAPDALCGQVVLVAFSDYYHQAAYQGGVFRKELLEGWLAGQKLTEVNLPTFMEHSTYDDFWKGLSAEAHADRVNAPGVYIGGWYDIFLQGTINSFVGVQERGGPQARGKNFLVIGPIAHGAFNQKVVYPKASESPINMTAPLDIMGNWLHGKPSIDHIPAVHYYVMGDTEDPSAPGNLWRSADSWPPPAQDTSFYFHSDHALRREPPADAARLDYKYDPDDPVPTIGGQNLLITKGPMDQRPAESRPDVLLFSTDPLPEPVEVTGRITAQLYISSDCPDTDFTVKLCDVFPDGKSMLVTDGIRRASLRQSYEQHEPLEPGKVYEVSVDLWSTSLVFNRGHRIRVAVSSSNSPRFEPNPNTGEPHPTGKSRIAANTLHLAASHPSHIVLPIHQGEPGEN